MNVFTRHAAVGLAAAAALTLAACSSGTTASNGSTSTPVTSAAGSASTSGMMTSAAMSGAALSSKHNDADATFAQMMIVHHQGAIEMADLAPTRAASQQVKDWPARSKPRKAPRSSR